MTAPNPRARVLAFYLPQFHPTPENDEWWGPGFTEWTNAAKAKTLFPGHYQPHVPADLGFYDLRVPEARAAQAALARAHGVEGFCYYHYWFGGRRMLQRPFQEVLASGDPDFPFCLCWANHSWSNIWQGVANRILIEQTYPGMADHDAHFDWLLAAFRDRRYITVDGKPVLLIYDAPDIPDVKRVMDHWRERALRAGLPGLYLVGVAFRALGWDPRTCGLDASTWQPLPQKDGHIPWRYPHVKMRMKLARGKYRFTVYDYREVLDSLLRRRKPDWVDHPTVLPNWDNTPRSGLNGMVLHEATPELFRIHLRRALDMCADLPAERRLVFVKAWNEWAEGNHLEPDQRFGHGFLEVVRDEVRRAA